MQVRRLNLPGSPRNPLIRLLLTALATAALAGALVIGMAVAFVFSVLSALATVFAALRARYLRGDRQRPAARAGRAHRTGKPAGAVIEGEYTVIDSRRTR